MIAAAGILILTGDDRRALFVRCVDTGLWVYPGGKVEDGETPQRAAEREVAEEVGKHELTAPSPLMRRVRDGVDFTTYVARSADEFVPTLSAEHDAWTWAAVDNPPQPIHPGAVVALARSTMDELGIARAMSTGDLTSPQKYGHIWLFNIRLTGTGLAYREGRREYCWRDPSVYLDPEFLARCNGLPVVLDHPETKPALDHQEFTDRVAGTVFLPYVQGDEVWAVVKVWRDECVDFMLSDQVSTSPGVVFREATSTNETLKLSDGSTLLLEGKPALLDHVAICAAGVWDKGGPPTGVLNDFLTRGSSAMPTEAETAAADKARKDTEDKLNAVLDALGRVTGRLDAMEAKETAAKDRAARRDAARKDRFGSRKDGETFKAWKDRHDADENAMLDALKDSDESEEQRKKWVRDCRKDAEDEERGSDEKGFDEWAKEEMQEPNHRDDKARKDEGEEAAEAKRKREAEEAARLEREESARKDSVENADLKARLAAFEAQLRGLTRETSADDRDALARAQARADSAAALFGDQSPPPIPGETPRAYRQRILARFQPYSERFKNSRFDGMDDASFTVVEDQVYHDTQAASRKPATAMVGRLHETITVDPAGRRISRYDGDMNSWLGMFKGSYEAGRVNNRPNHAGA